MSTKQAFHIDSDEVKGAESFMERLWAYMTIKQLLEQAEADDVDPSEGGTSDDKYPAQWPLTLQCM